MIPNHMDVTQGWDAREHFVRELVLRGHIVNEASDSDPKAWLEAIKDFFNWSFVFYPEEEAKIEKEISDIDKLLWSKAIVKDGMRKVFNDLELKARKLEAYEKMDNLYRKMHKLAYLAGAYMPVKQKRDPSRAIANYYPKKTK